MATKYEGIVIELGADTSDLQSAMRQVNSAASKTQKELNQIKTALKFNPGNMTLLAQQTGQLSNKVEQTKDRLKVLQVVPYDLTGNVIYPAAQVVNKEADETEQAAAKDFVEFLTSDEAAAIFRNYYFDTEVE